MGGLFIFISLASHLYGLNEIKSKLEQLGLSLGMKIDERLIDSTNL